jgi:RNA polymerase sigma-70 factor (ECF subfamily)
MASRTATEELDRLFRQRLCALVEREMNARYRRREDPEDVVQSVFRTFFRRAALGQYHVAHNGAMWKLLEQITRRKILKHVEYHRAKKRDVAQELPLPDDAPHEYAESAADARLLGNALECVLRGLDSPEPEVYRLQLHGYTVAEILETVLNGLDTSYVEILALRLQGHTEDDIAAQVGCGREAVRYRLKRLVQRLRFLLRE